MYFFTHLTPQIKNIIQSKHTAAKDLMLYAPTRHLAQTLTTPDS